MATKERLNLARFRVEKLCQDLRVVSMPGQPWFRPTGNPLPAGPDRPFPLFLDNTELSNIILRKLTTIFFVLVWLLTYAARADGN
jgi:hypothetical protein